jgi:hypothetical protein
VTDLYEHFAVPVDPEFRDELKAQLDARRLVSERHPAPTTAPRTEEVTLVLKPVSQSRPRARLIGLIAAAVVTAAAAGTVLVLATGDDDSGESPAATLPTPSPAPTAAPTTTLAVAVPGGWSDYTSSRFGYSIQYPPEWTATPADEDWPVNGFPDPHGTGLDRFAPSADSPLFVYVSSTSNAAGQAALAEMALAANAGVSMCQISDGHQITVDGATAHQEDQFCFDRDYLIEVLVTSGERFYQIDMFSDGPFTNDQRRVFDQMLASLRFDS